MKFFRKLWAVLFAAILASMFSVAMADDVKPPKTSGFKVNGVTGAGATSMTIKDVSNDKLTIEIQGIAAVWKQDPGKSYGAARLPSEDDNPKKSPQGKHDYVLSYAANPAAFAGARQCILKRGADWPGTADLKSLKLDDPRVACTPIAASAGQYAIDVAGEYDLLGFIPVIEFKDGTRAWGSHPFGQSRGKNSKGQTITLIELSRDNGRAVAAAQASNTAKRFFSGSFE
jgi:hypothetical protein